MAQAVNRRPLTAKARVRARVSLCGICGAQSDSGTVFFQVLGFPVSISFHRVSPYIYITCGMNNWPVGGCSSEI
jgi:hypothetical protein